MRHSPAVIKKHMKVGFRYSINWLTIAHLTHGVLDLQPEGSSSNPLCQGGSASLALLSRSGLSTCSSHITGSGFCGRPITSWLPSRLCCAIFGSNISKTSNRVIISLSSLKKCNLLNKYRQWWLFLTTASTLESNYYQWPFQGIYFKMFHQFSISTLHIGLQSRVRWLFELDYHVLGFLSVYV